MTHAKGGASISPTGLIIGAIVAVAGTFLFRFLTVEYTNDHFVHLSRVAQILYGDVPIRDFFDPCLTLQYYASAAALYSLSNDDCIISVFWPARMPNRSI